MHDGTHVLAGECTMVFDGSREREQRGDVVVLVKPDNTVLVHDADGYQPVAWLTRADSVTVESGTVVARDGDELLRVVTHDEHGRGRYPASVAGVPVGDCPDCRGTLVRADGAVSCTDCDARYGLPDDASVTGRRCGDCDLPTVRAERGRAFEVCLDRECDSLDERVKTAFDREWTCPECGSDLRILRRGGLIAGCERYPDCDTGFSLPAGVIIDDCDCGLPVFETATGWRCLDARCDQSRAADAD
ncbi:topoisomerase DNA-binding C4 zinc finger domain-containing protein [Halomicrobium salinisoli]|uniref:topoisomerase DNA-binding C4 zinc finger domain-containing protein n=1 Tax=Halomicrobium salinisoli TaxID=2878391 RepID=UPI001CF04355|nr:topoisomerase DNA-binding C4 zinc finger domain-containing protein [Halomicrobium salinisoli]